MAELCAHYSLAGWAPARMDSQMAEKIHTFFVNCPLDPTAREEYIKRNPKDPGLVYFQNWFGKLWTKKWRINPIIERFLLLRCQHPIQQLNAVPNATWKADSLVCHNPSEETNY